jgi:hypothetical protein
MPPALSLKLEPGVELPSYAVIEPVRTNLNIDIDEWPWRPAVRLTNARSRYRRE